MFLRYLAAIPLLVVSTTAVPIGYRVLHAYMFRRWFRGDEFDLAQELRNSVTDHIVVWPTLLAIVLMVVFWWMTTEWPKIALVPSAPAAIGGALTSMFDGWQHLATGATAPVVACGLAWLAARIMTWPATADVRRSGFELGFGLRGGGRLRVQSRRLLLDKLPPPAHFMSPMGRVAIRFDRISHVEAGFVNATAQRQLANSTVLTLEPGPVLRIIGGGQQWLLPVDDAPALARLVTERAPVRALAKPRPPLDHGHWWHAKQWWQRAHEEPPTHNTQKVNHGNRWAALIISALMTPMACYSLYYLFGGDWSWGRIFAVFFTCIPAWIATHVWFRQGVVYQLNEENPVSPLAHDPDPRQVPVTGWSSTPVVLGQTSDL